MPISDQIWSFLGKKILIFTGESKSFGTHITKKPPGHLVCIVFWSDKDMERKKNPGRRVKKSSPSPLLGHRLPVTALALSARRPFGPARFARGLDNHQHEYYAHDNHHHHHHDDHLETQCTSASVRPTTKTSAPLRKFTSSSFFFCLPYFIWFKSI